MMKKILLNTALIALLFISCKKQEFIAPKTLSNNYNARVITANPTQPLPVAAPALFFFDTINTNGNYNYTRLYKVDNLLADKPMLVKKAILDEDDNAVWGLVYGRGWAYNTSTNQISTLSIYNTLITLSTVDYKAKETNFFGKESQHNSNIRFTPDNTKFYYISGSACGSIMIGNISGQLPITVFDENNKTKIGSMDIDFEGGKIYFTDIITNSIYAINLDGTNKVKIASITLGESVDFKSVDVDCLSVLRIDKSQNKLFFSTHSNKYQSLKKYKLFSVSTTGTNMKKLLETNDTSYGSYFSFDVLPGSNKIFYCICQGQDAPNYPSSIVGRMNMDGTGNTTLYVGATVRDVIVAMPNGLK
jgi:hypothetical protein